MVIYQRPRVVGRSHIIVRAVDVGIAYELDMLPEDGHLGNECRNILIDVGSKDGLDHEHMVQSLHGLEHAQIIHVTVTVEVEVGKHV